MAIRLADLAIPLKVQTLLLFEIKIQDCSPSTNVYRRLHVWISTGDTKTTPTVGATILDLILESETNKSLVLV